ncbi:hypothetical protein [Obesumbacterium proteus]|uniref:hypothetical protein n=1 Tax=Obesumbacterium proteus TaxID=82983 RepID=UPI00242DC32F|nr:hypothetical protein [Obesumbacterium proteus]
MLNEIDALNRMTVTDFEGMKSNKPFDIPGFHESVKRDFEASLITLEEAAIEFYKGNWTTYIDKEYTKKQLGLI